MKWFSILVVAACLPALSCKQEVALYCTATEACSAGLEYCDVNGVCPESEGIGNTCISAPCWDAAPGDPDATPGAADAAVADASADAAADAPRLLEFAAELDSGADASFNDLFGISTAVSGDVLVIGAHRDGGGSETGSGSAYVFERSGGNWAFYQRLSVGTGQQYAFGISVAVSGSMIAVGAPGDNSQRGAVYVFERGPAVWAQVGKLSATDAASQDALGTSVAIDGNTVAAGATAENEGGTLAGAVYVFTRSGATWPQAKKIVGAAGESFGQSVSLANGVLIAGTNGKGAEIWEGSGTNWARVLDATPTLLGAPAGLEVGISVSTDGELAAIGAPDQGGTLPGKVYVVDRANGWGIGVTPFTTAGATFGFGGSVSIRDNVLAVGDSEADAQKGRAYVFERFQGSWLEPLDAMPNAAVAGDLVGIAVAVSADALVVGAPMDDGNGNESGVGYLWNLR